MEMKLILVPHGATQWTILDRVEGNIPLPPLEVSLENLRGLESDLQPLEIKGVYCHNNQPGKSSGTTLAEVLHLPLWEAEELAPLDMGAWSGLTWLEVRERFGRIYRHWHARPDQLGPPCGEPILEAANRLRPLVKRLRTGRKNAIIVAGREIMIALQLLLSEEVNPEMENWPWCLFPRGCKWLTLPLSSGKEE